VKKVRRGATFVDCFTSLDLKRKQQADIFAVLAAIMKAGGRFSVFDATENAVIAGTMDRITRSGWVRRIEEKSAYPWVVVELTTEGRAALSTTEGKP
jgi:hypothetical protein